MLRLSVFVLLGLGLNDKAAHPGGKDNPVQKDLANLKGTWISAPVKHGDKEYLRFLRLGKSELLLVMRQPGGPEPFKELVELYSVVEKDKKRFLNFVGALIPNEYRVEYELAGDTLMLKGSAGGIDLSGEYIRQKKVKKDAKAERIADQLASYEILASSFLHLGNRGFGKGLSEFAIVRIARMEEPIELKFAHCLSIAQDGDVDVERPTFKGLVKSEINLRTAVLELGMKEPKFAEALVKSRVEALAAANKEDERKASDEWEIRYNNELTAEDAARYLRVAAMVDAVTTEQHRKTRTLLRDQILKALVDDPEALKKLAQAPEPSDDLRNSRVRVRELMEQARKK